MVGENMLVVVQETLDIKMRINLVESSSSNKKSFKCQFCEKHFSRKDDFSRHERSHSNANCVKKVFLKKET